MLKAKKEKNRKKEQKDTLGPCKGLLAPLGLALNESIRGLLRRHAELIREWNRVASLVSAGDIRHLEGIHTVDSLSLAPLVAKYGWGNGLLDIGSGGGFPALALKILFPEMPVVLVERSEKKVGFLRRAVAVLGLEDVEIRHGEFPDVAVDFVPGLITARAVEKPARVFTAILDRLGMLPSGSVFLCQMPIEIEELGPMFHVERWEDEWTRRRLRRGVLHVIRRMPETPNLS